MAVAVRATVGTKHAHAPDAFAHEHCKLVVLRCEEEVAGRREGWKCLGVLLKFCLEHQVMIVKCPRCKEWVATRLQLGP
jgi:hypothetical protein